MLTETQLKELKKFLSANVKGWLSKEDWEKGKYLSAVINEIDWDDDCPHYELGSHETNSKTPQVIEF